MTLRPHPDVSLLARRTLHAGRVFELAHVHLRLPSGLEQRLDLVEHPGAVAVLAHDARGRMLVVRQFRAAAGDWTLELPAGRLDPGEEPQAAAGRELEEETGLVAGRLEPLRTFLPAVGFCSEVIHLFRAHDLRPAPGGGRACDEDEELEVLWVDPVRVLQQPLADAKTLIGALLGPLPRG